MPDPRHTLRLSTDQVLSLVGGMETARAVLLRRIAAAEIQLEAQHDFDSEVRLVVMRKQLADFDDVIEDHLKPCFGDLYDELMREEVT